jgi:phospholipid transport system substrate-binding protein
MNRTAVQIDMKKLIAAFVLIFHFTSGYAEESPDRIVMRVTDEVMKLVRTDKQLRNGDLVKATTVVETLIAPHFDFSRLTAGVLPKTWPSASPSQQDRVTREFRTMLVRTLALALSTLTDERIVFDTSIVPPNGKEAMVRCRVLSPGEEAEGLEYALEKSENGWKAHDMKVGGVSLLAMYREQFAPIVRTQGIDGLISILEQKNLAAKARYRKF